jgi:glycosyltransferase involved in cell wall biosynthesis
MEPRVSIIIPVYNGEKTLKQCLSSVLEQDFENYEVIVVDNNSTDKTKQIIKEFQKENEKVMYFFEREEGRGAARNTGEKEAKGEIILMTDSDCIVPGEWIKGMTKAIEGYDAVQGFEEAVSDNFWSRYKQIDSEEKYKKEKTRDLAGKIDTKNFAIKRDVLERIGLTCRKYVSGNDTELSVKLVKNCCEVRFIKNIKVKHFHADSLRKIIKQQALWAQWIVIISRDNKEFFKGTNFLRYTGQSVWDFFRFFPGIFGTLIKKGFKYAYYDLVIGLSWRWGLIQGWLKK